MKHFILTFMLAVVATITSSKKTLLPTPIDNADVIYIEGGFPAGNQNAEVVIDCARAILERKKLR